MFVSEEYAFCLLRSNLHLLLDYSFLTIFFIFFVVFFNLTILLFWVSNILYLVFVR